MLAARSEARKSTASATSSGSIRRPDRRARGDARPLRRRGRCPCGAPAATNAIAPSVIAAPGADGVDADAVRGELDRQRLGQPGDGVLRGGVVHLSLARRRQGVDRRDVDDRRRGVPTRPRPAGELAGAHERAGDVDARRCARTRRSSGRVRHRVGEDPGVVDEDVERAGAVEQRRSPRPRRRCRPRPASARGPRSRRRSARRSACRSGVAVGDDDGGAGLGEPVGDGRTRSPAPRR